MKKFIGLLICLTISACTTVKYRGLSKSEMMELAGNNQASEFKITDMMLFLKVNHSEKTFKPCEGTLPSQEEHESISFLYPKKKLNNSISFERTTLTVFSEGAWEYVIFGIAPSELEATVNACQKVEKYYIEQGYSEIPTKKFNRE